MIHSIVAYIETYLLQNRRVQVEDLVFVKEADKFKVKHGDVTVIEVKTHLPHRVMKRRVLRELNYQDLWTPSSKEGQRKFTSKRTKKRFSDRLAEAISKR